MKTSQRWPRAACALLGLFASASVMAVIVTPTGPASTRPQRQSTPTQASVVQGRLLASNCFQCHGTQGSGGFEKLAGMSAKEVYAELKEFASGKEHPDSIMAAHATGFTDEQMRQIAAYFASIR